jgi:hypothetical protein
VDDSRLPAVEENPPDSSHEFFAETPTTTGAHNRGEFARREFTSANNSQCALFT